MLVGHLDTNPWLLLLTSFSYHVSRVGARPASQHVMFHIFSVVPGNKAVRKREVEVTSKQARNRC